MRRACFIFLSASLLALRHLPAQSVRIVTRSANTPGGTYRLFLPASSPRGLLVMLSDWGDTYAAFDRQAPALPGVLQERGLAVLQINNTPWQSNNFSEASLGVVESILVDVVRETGVPPGRIVMGGVQMAGAAALRYAERCAEGRCPPATRPAGVFAVESTLDLMRFSRAIGIYVNRPGGTNLEGHRAELASLERELGGTFDAIPDVYRRNSVYLAFDVDGGRAALLRNTAVRLYTGNDLAWYVTVAGADPLSSNIADMTGLALFLRRIGNEHVDIVTPAIRVVPGRRPGPLAWSLFDERDIADWVLRILP